MAEKITGLLRVLAGLTLMAILLAALLPPGGGEMIIEKRDKPVCKDVPYPWP